MDWAMGRATVEQCRDETERHPDIYAHRQATSSLSDINGCESDTSEWTRECELQYKAEAASSPGDIDR